MSRFTEINSKQYRGNGFMTVAKYNNSGDIIYVGDKDSKTITSICANTFVILNKFTAHNGVVWNLDLSNDDNILISCSGDLTVCFWNTATTELLYQFNENCLPKFVCVQKNNQSTNQSNLLCVVCEAIGRRSQTYILIYDMNQLTNSDPNNSNNFNFTQKLLWNNSNKITCVEWHENNTLMFGCDDGQIILRNIMDIDGTNEIKYKFHDNQIKSICWNKSFSNILTGSLDSTSKIINTTNWEILNTFVSTVPINYASYNFNEKKIFVGGGVDAINVAKTSKNDLSLKVYRIQDSKLMQKMDCHFGPIRFISKSPSNKNFLTASQDGMMKIHICDDVPINTFADSNNADSDKTFLFDEINKFENVNWKASKSSNANVPAQKWIPGMPRIIDNSPKSELFTLNNNLSESVLNSIENIKEEQAKANSSIRITNLPSYISHSELNDIFDLYGRIEDKGIRILKYDDNTMAFINYSFPESAHKAIAQCDGLPIEHCIIHVEMAQNKSNR